MIAHNTIKTRQFHLRRALNKHALSLTNTMVCVYFGDTGTGYLSKQAPIVGNLVILHHQGCYRFGIKNRNNETIPLDTYTIIGFRDMNTGVMAYKNPASIHNNVSF